MKKLFLALLVAALAAGCSVVPVQYMQVPVAANQIVQVCDPACRYVYAAQTTTVVTPPVVYTPVYTAPPLYSPFTDIAVGYMLWRGFGGYSGHHHR